MQTMCVIDELLLLFYALFFFDGNMANPQYQLHDPLIMGPNNPLAEDPCSELCETLTKKNIMLL